MLYVVREKRCLGLAALWADLSSVGIKVDLMPNSEEFRYVNWRVWRVYKVYGWVELVLLPF